VEFVERLILQGSHLHTLAADFIYPCSHLSAAGTEQFKMSGETRLSLNLCLHRHAYSGLFVPFRVPWPLIDAAQTDASKPVASYPLSASRYHLHVARNLLLEAGSSWSQNFHHQASGLACDATHREPFSGRVTVGPLLTYSTTF
jgi:hypothetical protein